MRGLLSDVPQNMYIILWNVTKWPPHKFCEIFHQDPSPIFTQFFLEHVSPSDVTIIGIWNPESVIAFHGLKEALNIQSTFISFSATRDWEIVGPRRQCYYPILASNLSLGPLFIWGLCRGVIRRSDLKPNYDPTKPRYNLVNGSPTWTLYHFPPSDPPFANI